MQCKKCHVVVRRPKKEMRETQICARCSGWVSGRRPDVRKVFKSRKKVQ